MTSIEKHNHDHSLESHKACVSLVPIFKHLDEEQLDEIMAATRSVSFEKGEIIYREGDEADSLYIIHKGKVRIYRLTEAGKEQLVRLLNPGDFTGETALFTDSVHESYAEAMMETKVCVIQRSVLQGFLLKFPSISLKILQEFSNRLNTSETQTTRFSSETVETRIALFLTEQMDQKNDRNIVYLPMSKKDLASYLGTTPETISRKFAELEAKGLIRQTSTRQIEILEVDELLLV